jgi:predicted molibdopterin-dependent oxidoreductase YjgC
MSNGINEALASSSALLARGHTPADRLQFPLKRQADGSFARMSWDTALTEIAERLLNIRDAYGGEAFAFAGAVRIKKPATSE